MKSCFSPLRGAGLWSAQSQLCERCSLVRPSARPLMFTGGGEDGASGGMAGGRGGLELFKDELYFRDSVFFAAWQDIHGCPWVCEQLPDPCVLYTRNSASISASMKIRRLWSLPSRIVALVSLCQQNISHTQRPSILIYSAFGCSYLKGMKCYNMNKRNV